MVGFVLDCLLPIASNTRLLHRSNAIRVPLRVGCFFLSVLKEADWDADDEVEPNAAVLAGPVVDDAVTRPSRRGGGGAWRAFLHERGRHKKVSGQGTKELAREYRNLSREEKARFAEMGRQATLAHRMGGTTFPMYSRRTLYQRGGEDDTVVGPARVVDTDFADLSTHISDGQSISLPSVNFPNSMDIAENCKAEFEAVARHQSKLIRATLTCKKDESARVLHNIITESKHKANEILEQRHMLKEINHCSWVAPPHTSPSLVCCFKAKHMSSVWEATPAGGDNNMSAYKFEPGKDVMIASGAANGKVAVQPATRISCYHRGTCTCTNNPAGSWQRKDQDSIVCAYLKKVTALTRIYIKHCWRAESFYILAKQLHPSS